MSRRVKVNLLLFGVVVLWILFLWGTSPVIVKPIAYGCLGWVVGKFFDERINWFVDKYWSD